MLKNIESVDLTTFGGRLYFDIYNKYDSISNFCKVNNYHYTKINQYVNNKILPNIQVVLDFAKVGLDIDFLMKGEKSKKVEVNKKEIFIDGFVNLPYFNAPASAGVGAFEDDNYEIIKYPKALLKDIRNPAMTSVSGDSMSPEIAHKDLLIFERVNACKNGNIIICNYQNNNFVKKFIQTPKHLCLRSFNPAFDDIKIESELIILGVVKRVIKSY